MNADPVKRDAHIAAEAMKGMQELQESLFVSEAQAYRKSADDTPAPFKNIMTQGTGYLKRREAERLLRNIEKNGLNESPAEAADMQVLPSHIVKLLQLSESMDSSHLSHFTAKYKDTLTEAALAKHETLLRGAEPQRRSRAHSMLVAGLLNAGVTEAKLQALGVDAEQLAAAQAQRADARELYRH